MTFQETTDGKKANNQHKGESFENLVLKKLNELIKNQNVPGVSRYIVGMIIFGSLLLFIILLYISGNKDKWIGIYTKGEYKNSRK